ncbi:hypothetical protein CYMTET_30668, partial [Cymbomonas tetramitiformis]
TNQEELSALVKNSTEYKTYLKWKAVHEALPTNLGDVSEAMTDTLKTLIELVKSIEPKGKPRAYLTAGVIDTIMPRLQTLKDSCLKFQQCAVPVKTSLQEKCISTKSVAWKQRADDMLFYLESTDTILRCIANMASDIGCSSDLEKEKQDVKKQTRRRRSLVF